jgi:hypothetical protein
MPPFLFMGSIGGSGDDGRVPFWDTTVWQMDTALTHPVFR